MTLIEAAHRGIRSLEGIQYCPSLRQLNLQGNAVADLGPIAGMAQVSDLVAGCWRLNHLFMSDNQISDLGPLAAVKYLADLDLAGNAIVDLAPLVTNTDFGTGDRIWLARNPLSDLAVGPAAIVVAPSFIFADVPQTVFSRVIPLTVIPMIAD